MKRPRNLLEWAALCAVSAAGLAILWPSEAIDRARQARQRARLADAVDDDREKP